MKKLLCVLLVLLMLCGCSNSSNVKALVEKEDGTTEEVSASEVLKKDKENPAYYSDYAWRPITIESTIERMDTDYVYLKGNWAIDYGGYTKYIKNLSNGDKVEVIGVLSNFRMDDRLVISYVDKYGSTDNFKITVMK